MSWGATVETPYTTEMLVGGARTPSHQTVTFWTPADRAGEEQLATSPETYVIGQATLPTLIMHPVAKPVPQTDRMAPPVVMMGDAAVVATAVGYTRRTATGREATVPHATVAW